MTTQRPTDSRLAYLGASLVHDAYADYQARFQAITARAGPRFARREWVAMQTDAAERLDLYRQVVARTVAELHGLLDERVQDKLVWASLKAVYSGLIAARDDWELAETFFNSITRRTFTTVGVDPQIEFVDTDFETPPTHPQHAVSRRYGPAASTAALVQTILTDYAFPVGYQDVARDARRVAAEVEAALEAVGAARVVEQAEMITAVFYRRKGAYLVGRLSSGAMHVPLVLALLNEPAGLIVDAVLLDENDVSILFSYARSYFHVGVVRPYDLVRFLKVLMPRKRIAELYISIGFNKHGKTELYRNLLHYLADADDRFEIARGQQGMVMVVFTLPAYDVVFKVIKDHFPYPKHTTREAVMAKYRLVFNHDRAGRLVDAQEFEYLQFERSRFSAELLRELRRVAGQTVQVAGDDVVIQHAYIERRVTPLNLYVHEAEDEAARAAVVDYGQAIKELAATNIFPGDMLLKNFGVTRHGRVVFYDYDELCLLTGCRFRAMPPPASEEEALSAEPWFSVDEDDILPEEFRHFLGLPAPLHEVFMQHHADLFDVHFWHETQARLSAGEVIDIFPYRADQRLDHR